MRHVSSLLEVPFDAGMIEGYKNTPQCNHDCLVQAQSVSLGIGSTLLHS